jgi:ubiquitin-conjugating enzyme E2 variant
MYIAVVANGLLVTFSFGYLLAGFDLAWRHWYIVVIALGVSYFVADFASGVVHWATDTWFNEKQLGRLIGIAREHHTHPRYILGYRFLEHATLGSTPSAGLFWPIALLIAASPGSIVTYVSMITIFTTSLCLLCGGFLHNFGHRRATSPIARLAQRFRLVITPEHHAIHHLGDQTIQYCIVNGWANPLCDKFGIWRTLESIVSKLTGACARENDHKWQEHFRITGELIRISRGGD